MASRVRPIEKFAAATAKCPAEGAAYGRCIVAQYQSVSKDMCHKEFEMFKTCFLKAIGKKA